MSQILITNSFNKELAHTRIATVQDVTILITRHQRGLPSLISLYSSHKEFTVLKGYLGKGRSLRIAILLQVKKETYIPFFVAKKSSQEGWNVSKYSKEYLAHRIDRALIDIQQHNYTIIQLA